VKRGDDRLRLVIRLREQREHEHLVARAQAQRQAAVARERVSDLLRAMNELGPEIGTVTDAQGLRGTRMGALGLADEAVVTERERQTAERRADQAEGRRKEAAIARRSVERLEERRDAEVAREAELRRQHHDDEAGLGVWRRSR
jgi:hypothetical protein